MQTKRINSSSQLRVSLAKVIRAGMVSVDPVRLTSNVKV